MYLRLLGAALEISFQVHYCAKAYRKQNSSISIKKYYETLRTEFDLLLAQRVKNV